MGRRFIYGLLVIALVLSFSSTVLSGEDIQRPLPEGIESLKLDSPLRVDNALDHLGDILDGNSGPQQVLVLLVGDSVSQVYAKQLAAGKVDPDEQLAQLRKLKRSQDQAIGAALALDPELQVLGAMQRLLNGVIMEIDSSVIDDLANDPLVAAIIPVVDYELDSGETAPTVGVSAAQGNGYTGAGVSVAVLDSGIDYLHLAMGGAGDPDEFAANNPAVIEPGTFPTEKVAGGHDFVGGAWPYGDLAPDPDPLDAGPARGHGTHVAGVIGGLAVPSDDIKAGVAPDVEFYALKVCSSVTSDCSGVALLRAMEYVVDPNGDGVLTDAVDIINLSLGRAYGDPAYDLLTPAIEQASKIGVLTLAAAGNAAENSSDNFTEIFGDKPYSHESPGNVPSALGVAATRSPWAVLESDPGTELSMHVAGYSARGPSPTSNAIKPDIGAPDAAVSAVAGSGSGVSLFGGTSAATPYVTGAAALVRQSLVGVVGSRDTDMPFIIRSMLVGGGETDIKNEPGIMGRELAPITRVGGGELRVDRAVEAPVALWEASVDETRSPHLSFGQIDVTEEWIIVDKTVEVHNLTGEWQNFELSSSFRYDDDESSGAVKIDISPWELKVPPRDEGKTPEATFNVRLTIDAKKLKEWTMNSGAAGASGDILTANEFDGYIWLDDLNASEHERGGFHMAPHGMHMARHGIHMAWQVLPRLAGDVRADSDQVIIDDEYQGLPAGTVELRNLGVGPGFMDPYAWVAHSPRKAAEGTTPVLSQRENARAIIDLKDVGVATYRVPAGYCSEVDSFVMAIAITTYDRATHAVSNPLFRVPLDIDRDGVNDYEVFNFDLSLSGGISDGRSAAWVLDLETGAATAHFYLDHGTNSSNFVLVLCGEQIGMRAADISGPISMQVLAQDWYYSGAVTDQTEKLEITPLGERYLSLGSDITAGETETWIVLDLGGEGANEAGILLLLDASRKAGIRGGAAVGNESLVLRVVSP